MAGFSKLIWADSLANAQAQKPLIVQTGKTGSLVGNINADSGVYSEGASKAVLFTADGYIVTHGHQYYTGIPTADSTLGVVKPYAIATSAVTATTTTANWDETDDNGNAKYKIYGIQTDSEGKPFVVVDDAAGILSHKLTFSDGTNSLVFDPTQDTTLTFGTYNDADSHIVHNKFRITTSITGANPDHMDVTIDPAIHNNLVLGNGKTAAAKHILVNTTAIDADGVDGGSNCSINLEDSGLMFSLVTAGTLTNTAFVKADPASHENTADAWLDYSDVNIPTEQAIAKYVHGALGEIAGAMRYSGSASGTSGNWQTANWKTTENYSSSVENPVSASYSSETPYKQGDVYYVTTAGYYAGQYCEVGDMLIAKNDQDGTYKASDWTIVQSNWNAENKGATLAYNKSVVIATVGGVDITATLPSAADNTATYTLVTAGKGDVVTDGTATDGFTFAGAAESTNGQAGFALGANKKSVLADGTVAYSSEVTYITVEGIAGTDKTTNPIKVTNTADGKILILHDTDVTTQATGITGTTLRSLALDEYGHVTTTHNISNKISITSDAESGAINNYADGESFGGNLDYSVKIAGAAITAGNGAEANDLSLATSINGSTLTITPTFKLRYRAVSINGTDLFGTDTYSTLNFKNGANVSITKDSDDSVLITARDTWRSVKYYVDNAATSSNVVGANNADDAFNDGAESASASDAQKSNLVEKTLGTNPLVFGSEFIFAKGEAGATGTENLDPEVHIEWCEISASGVSYTF